MKIYKKWWFWVIIIVVITPSLWLFNTFGSIGTITDLSCNSDFDCYDKTDFHCDYDNIELVHIGGRFYEATENSMQGINSANRRCVESKCRCVGIAIKEDV
jgi:hypothetical protein